MQNITNKVKRIINEVKTNGDTAVVKYVKKFDGIKDFVIKNIKLLAIHHPLLTDFNDKEFENAIKTAIQNVKKFHLIEYKRIKKSWTIKYNNMILGQKFAPIESVGIYIPGGKYGFNYISTILMSVIPAQIAGVKKIVVVTPPKNVSPYFLYTTKLLGIKEIYAVGGVQAIAALAFGTKTIPKVDMIIGPGNKWVTEAKRQLIGVVGIDLLAGPSEVVVVADKTVPVEQVVYELLAQAEHDKEAKSYLIGLDREIIRSSQFVIRDLDKKYLSQIKFIFFNDIKKVIKIVNDIAPEHLAILTNKYCDYIFNNVTNAGAIFLGKNSSAVFGDYIAGPSHILPTNKTARFSSGVSVMTFMKKISIIKFNKQSVKKFANDTMKLAEIEGMVSHKKLVQSKIKN